MADLLLEYSNVKLEHMGELTDGRMKLTDQAVVFKNSKTGKVETIQSGDVVGAQWSRLANTPALKLKLKNNNYRRFGNLSEQDFDKIKSFAHNVWQLELEKEEMAVKGWNYGRVDVDPGMLSFWVDGKTAFHIPMENVMQVSTGKNETIVAHHPNDDAAVSLTEIRFHISPNDEDEEGADPTGELRDKILEHANVVKDTDAPLAMLEQVMCNPPRGRYDLKLFPNHLSFHGKSFDYKVPVKSILRLFLLPHKDGRHMFFVMGLDPPIRQGQTRYHYIVLEFLKDEEIDVQMSLTDEELSEKYGDKLQSEMSGRTFEVISRIMRALVNQRITVPGTFIGHSGAPAVGAAYKSTAGNLYPLEKGFVFVNKPTMYIRYEEISIVHFARSDLSTRSFDFEIELGNGVNHVFNSIEKDEYGKLYDFVSKKKLRIRNAKKTGASSRADDYAGSSDSEDDHYTARLKAEAAAGEGDDDDSDESDDDFDPEAEAQAIKIGSESEPDDEYDSDVKSTSEEEGDGEDDDDDSDGSAPEKKKKADKPEKSERKEKKEKEPKKRATKTTKKGKDPNAPKRASSAYMIWLNANRASLTKEGMGVTDVAKAAGVAWGKLEDKTEWEELAKKDKQRYIEEMDSYVPPDDLPSTSSSKKTKTSKPSKAGTSSKSTPTKGSQKSKEYVSTSEESDDGDKTKDGESMEQDDGDSD